MTLFFVLLMQYGGQEWELGKFPSEVQCKEEMSSWQAWQEEGNGVTFRCEERTG